MVQIPGSLWILGKYQNTGYGLIQSVDYGQIRCRSMFLLRRTVLCLSQMVQDHVLQIRSADTMALGGKTMRLETDDNVWIFI